MNLSAATLLELFSNSNPEVQKEVLETLTALETNPIPTKKKECGLLPEHQPEPRQLIWYILKENQKYVRDQGAKPQTRQSRAS